MSSWRDVAAAVLSGDRVEPVPMAAQPAASGLPIDVERGLASLSRRPPRKLVGDPAAWGQVVDDARRLAAEGWAAKGLALGWSPLDLFGVGSRDSWEFSGLAVWLNGRSLLAIDERTAAAGDVGRARFYARGVPGHNLAAPGVVVVPLWQFGKS